MIDVRVGLKPDVERVKDFYSPTPVSEDERFVLAEDDEELIGVVRLCVEDGHTMLRTMYIREGYRRQGIGKRMLKVFETLIPPAVDCYCVPHRYLIDFYGRIGFESISVDEAAPHLQERHGRYVATGRDVVVMRRPASSGASGRGI